MNLFRKEEWFEFESPVGEPEINWINQKENTGCSYKNDKGEIKYVINRTVNILGEPIWFGQKTTWVKKENKYWTILTYKNKEKVFTPCDTPVYETLYEKLN